MITRLLAYYNTVKSLLPSPAILYSILCLLVITLLSLWYGHHEHYALVEYKNTIATQIAVQQRENSIKDAQSKQTTKDIVNDYEKRIAIIKSQYANRVQPSPGTQTNSPTTSGTDGTPADPQFAEKCTLTTLQLETLQEWLKKQIGIEQE